MSLIVAHNLRIAFEIADQIGFLEDGRITEEGTPDEVSASKNPFVVEFLADRAAKARRITRSRPLANG